MLQQAFLPGGWSFESFQDPGITPRGWRPLDESDGSLELVRLSSFQEIALCKMMCQCIPKAVGVSAEIERARASLLPIMFLMHAIASRRLFAITRLGALVVVDFFNGNPYYIKSRIIHPISLFQLLRDHFHKYKNSRSSSKNPQSNHNPRPTNHNHQNQP